MSERDAKLSDESSHDSSDKNGNAMNRRDDDERVRRIAREAADRAVDDTLKRLGIDPQEWHDVQQDLAYLRRFRQGTDRVAGWVTRSVLTVVVTGVAWAVWYAIKGPR